MTCWGGLLNIFRHKQRDIVTCLLMYLYTIICGWQGKANLKCKVLRSAADCYLRFHYSWAFSRLKARHKHRRNIQCFTLLTGSRDLWEASRFNTVQVKSGMPLCTTAGVHQRAPSSPFDLQKQLLILSWKSPPEQDGLLAVLQWRDTTSKVCWILYLDKMKSIFTQLRASQAYSENDNDSPRDRLCCTWLFTDSSGELRVKNPPAGLWTRRKIWIVQFNTTN